MSEQSFIRLMYGINQREPVRENLRALIHKSLTGTPFSEECLTLIDTAFDIAFDGHVDTPPRSSGEAYIFHIVRSAIRMIERQKKFRVFDVLCIVEIIVHDCFEEVAKNRGHVHSVLEMSHVQLLLGTKVAEDTWCVTKQKHISETNEMYHARLLETKSWRPFIVKAEDRIDNMWTIKAMGNEKAQQKIKETELWFPKYEQAVTAIVFRNITQESMSPSWTSYIKTLYQELRDITRQQKLNL